MKILGLLVIATALLLAGCIQTPILYIPPVAHLSPSSEGEADVSLLAGTEEYSMRGAWSPVEHLELFALVSYHDSRSDSGRHAFHFYREAGAGWYTSAGTSITFSLLAGMGFGHAKGFGNQRPGGGSGPLYEVSGDYTRPFVGVGVGYSGKVDTMALIQRQQFGLTVRLARVDFATIHGQPGIESGEGWYLEPVFVSRSGAREAQFETQVGFNSVYSSTGIESVDMFASIGIHLQLDRLF